MKIFLFISFVFFSSYLFAKTIKLNYEPKGLIVRFHFDSIKVITDTTSFYQTFNKFMSVEHNSELILFKKAISNSIISNPKTDTLDFYGVVNKINDSSVYKIPTGWTEGNLMIFLALNNKLKIFDNSNNLIEKIDIKRVSKRHKVDDIYENHNHNTKKQVFHTKYIICDLPDF